MGGCESCASGRRKEAVQSRAGQSGRSGHGLMCVVRRWNGWSTMPSLFLRRDRKCICKDDIQWYAKMNSYVSKQVGLFFEKWRFEVVYYIGWVLHFCIKSGLILTFLHRNRTHLLNSFLSRHFRRHGDCRNLRDAIRQASVAWHVPFAVLAETWFWRNCLKLCHGNFLCNFPGSHRCFVQAEAEGMDVLAARHTCRVWPLPWQRNRSLASWMLWMFWFCQTFCW